MAKKRLIIVATFLAIAAIVALVATSLTHKKSPVEEPHPDRVDVSITNTDELKTMLLDNQYFAVVNTLADYIKATLNPKDLLVPIINKPKVAKNGNITITLQVKEPDKRLVAIIDRSTYFDKLVISIPQDDYRATIPIY
jgi:hypothetical protein